MIRVLGTEDREPLLDFLYREPAFNLFIISDVINFGFNQPFQEVWGEVDAAGAFKAVLLRYHGHFILSAPEGFDREGFLSIIKEHPDFALFSGVEKLVDSLLPDLPVRGVHRLRFAQLVEISRDFTINPDLQIFKAEVQNTEEIFQLHKAMEEFRTMPVTIDSLRHKLESKTGRVFYLRENGKMVSMAGTTAENRKAAMVVGVCTAEECRKKGRASACMFHLCREVLSEGKKLYLFYKNPEAGQIYKRLGFRDFGRWASAYT